MNNGSYRDDNCEHGKQEASVKALVEAEWARFTEWYNMANEGVKGCKDDANMVSQGEVITLIGSKDQRRSKLR